MSGTYYKAMYGTNTQQVPKIESEAERQKRAVKVLGGMKIHSSHLKRIQIGEELVDVPKIEYVNLLEGQIRELRIKVRSAEAKLIRLENNHMKLATEIAVVRRDMTGKVSHR